jgi:predicted dehydrogenase
LINSNLETRAMPEAIADDRPIRWGIIGAGWIAEQVCQNIDLTSGNVVAAVAARDGHRAASFAAKHGGGRSYDSYQALVDDDEVDVVYVATTHPNHRDHALLAIEAGKAVLIEKPVALNTADAREVFEAATSADVFAMEAMWMRTNPLIRRAQQLIEDGVIGEVRGLRHEFGLGLSFDPGHRLYDLGNGGGALLDLGIYPITFAYLYLGRPDQVHTFGTLSPTGSDDTVTMEWLYDGVPKAQLWCSASTSAPNEAAIYGSEGWISFASTALRPTGLTVHTGDTEYQVADPIEGQGPGYGPEIEEVERCLRAGLAQSPLVPQADTLAILELLDEARGVLGVKYPSE